MSCITDDVLKIPDLKLFASDCKDKSLCRDIMESINNREMPYKMCY